jgi:predicted secreted protein
MTIRQVWLVAVAVAGLAVAACGRAQSGGVDTVKAADSHTVTIAESQNGQTVAVCRGDEVLVTFEEAGGTGYSWTMEPVVSKALVVGAEESVALHPGLAGGPMRQVFHLRMKRAGTVILHFGFARPWMKGSPPEKTFLVTLRMR